MDWLWECVHNHLFLHSFYIVFSSHQKSYVQYDDVMMFWKWFQKFPHMHILEIFEVHFLCSIDVNDCLNWWCVGQGRAAAIFVTVVFLGFLSIAGFPAIVKEVKVSFLCEPFVCSLSESSHEGYTFSYACWVRYVIWPVTEGLCWNLHFMSPVVIHQIVWWLW